MFYFQAGVEQSILFLLLFPLSVLTTVLNTRQAVSDRPVIHESMCPAGCPENTRPACTQGTSRTNPSLSYPGCPGPRPNLDSKPLLLSLGLSAVQGPPPSPPPISRSGKSQIHDRRATSLPYAHTQVCAWDNKSVTCPWCLMQRPVLNWHRQGKSVTELCPVGRRTQPLTPTNTQTISLPDHLLPFHHFIISDHNYHLIVSNGRLLTLPISWA